jgi:hypothetical protein
MKSQRSMTKSRIDELNHSKFKLGARCKVPSEIQQPSGGKATSKGAILMSLFFVILYAYVCN